MLYRNANGFPSLHVEDGQTFTISNKSARELGIPVLKMRPRNTAALLTLAGQQIANAPRLSDNSAFEQIDNADGLVSFSDPDQDGRIDGYSVPFIKGVLQALDPKERMPPKSVKRLVALTTAKKGCACSSHDHAVQTVKSSPVSQNVSEILAYDTAALSKTHSVRETFVPEFVTSLRIFSLFTRLGDIVVGRNATLVLDSDLYFAIADNLLGYQGSRLVQRGEILNLDITGTLRGSITNIIHQASDVLKVDWKALSLQAATKP
ncbi:MAG: hypothetical protein ABIQ31_17425 [Ferruginibacter sp.]